MKTLLTCLALTFLLPFSQGVMAKNKYMYVINDSNSAVTLIINHNHCFNGTIPDPVNIKPHHKQTIIIKDCMFIRVHFRLLFHKDARLQRSI